MIKSRALTVDDIATVKQLHEKYYPEFGFPEFHHLMNAFVIEDEKQEIVMAGGIEAVAEGVLVTNKAKSRVKIGRALVEAQTISMFTCQLFGIRELYAFMNDDDYAKHFLKHGFSDCHRALSIKVPNGEK